MKVEIHGLGAVDIPRRWLIRRALAAVPRGEAWQTAVDEWVDDRIGD